MSGSEFDPLAPETFDSPFEVYADLRARCPVAHSDAWDGFWGLFRYDDVFKAATDWRTYVTSVQNVVPKVAFTGRRPPLHLDPPEHTPYRRALNQLFTAERMAELEPMTRDLAVELLQPLIDRGRGDICEEFSCLLPIRVFAKWMNMPEDKIELLREIARAYNLAVQAYVAEEVKVASLKLYTIAREMVDDRKANPWDPATDATTALLTVRDEDGNPLPEDLVIGCIRQVLVVGIIAPAVMVGNIAIHLSRHPELQAELRADPSLIPAAIEELLRLYTPYRGFARTAVRDVEMGGRVIKAGEPIALVYTSANRDEAKFPEADKFIIDRPNIADHLAFGRGPHRCAGAELGRMELKVIVEELLARTKGFRVDGDIRTTLFPEIGALSVPLAFEKA
ncbi:MAG: cytochrome P450 [Caulobacteraceae bacterium]